MQPVLGALDREARRDVLAERREPGDLGASVVGRIGHRQLDPGFDYWASHRGQGKYYDTEFNINGRRDVLKGYYTHRVTDLAVDWIHGARNPFLLVMGHKAPHGVWVPEPKYEHIFDGIDIRKPGQTQQSSKNGDAKEVAAEATAAAR